MLFRIHSNRICTCAQSLRTGDADAYVAEPPVSGQKNKPAKVGEDAARAIRTCAQERNEMTNLARASWAWSGCSGRATCRHCSSRRAIRSTRHTGVMSVSWRRPMSVGGRRCMSLILRHVMTLRCVRRIRAWVCCRTRRGYGRIYR